MAANSLFDRFLGFLQRDTKKQPQPMPSVVQIPFTAPELAALQELAYQLNVPFKDWLRNIIFAGAAKQSQQLSRQLEGTVHAERGWAALQDEDRELGYPVHDARVPGHPCTHLRALVNSTIPMTDCQGICKQPMLNGRICSFPAGVAARKCPQFSPRR